MWYQNWHIQTLQLFGITIQVWGLMLAIASIVGWLLFDYNLLKRKIKFDSSWLVFGFVLAGIVGARLMQVAMDWDYYSQHGWEIVKVWHGGMASFGAIILSFGFLFGYLSRFDNQQKKEILDAAVGPLMICLAVARVGCFLINDHLGKVMSGTWGIYWWGEYRQPLILYYIGWNLLVFVILQILFSYKKIEGKLFPVMMIMYGLGRMMIDILFKDFEGDLNRYWLTIILSGLLILIGAIWLGWGKIRKK